MPPVPSRPGNLAPALSKDPLTRGLVFAWAPGFPLVDFAGGRVLTQTGAAGITPAGGGRMVGAFTEKKYTVNCPVSGSAVSWYVASRQSTANDSTVMGAMNNAGLNEHLKFSGTAYLGPFSANRWASSAYSDDLLKPYSYTGIMRSGVASGSRVWVNRTLIATSNQTLSFPAQIGLNRASSVSPATTIYDMANLWLIWDRALSDFEMAAVRHDPWRVIARTNYLPNIVTAGAAAPPPPPPPPPSTFWGGYRTHRPAGDSGLRLRG
jgi:hypothetical protein